MMTQSETETPERHESTLKTYERAVDSGLYRRDTGGLHGKHDNVRRCWEDQITRQAAQDFLQPFLARRSSPSGVRVLDLGAGAGEGYEILTSLHRENEGLAEPRSRILPPGRLDCYLGVDVTSAMVEEGNRIYRDRPNVRFERVDLARGLGKVREEPPFDIYFSSYGSLSHLRDRELERLTKEIVGHCRHSCVLVLDLIGRYSVEWQPHWAPPEEGGPNMRQYSMSYLYPPQHRESVEAERFPLRYWGAAELHSFLARAVEQAGGKVARRELRDRSVLVGRHMNTGEFNPRAQPIRAVVNRLFEFNRRTELERLRFDYRPHDDFPALNSFFAGYREGWNAVVGAAAAALTHWRDERRLREPPSAKHPLPVRNSIRTIRNVVRNLEWFHAGDPRANVVEPQIGYLLRNLEMDLQRGLGAGHGLLALYWLEKG